MDYEVPATYFDGVSSRKRDVVARVAAELEIVENGVVVSRWNYDDLRQLDALPATLRIRSVAALELATLTISDQLARELISTRAGKLHFDGSRERSGTLRIVLLSLAAAVSLVLVTLLGIPLMADAIARVMPVWAEKKLGEAAANQVRTMFGDQSCSTPEGNAALVALAERLTAAHLRDQVKIEVLDTDVPNAIALPGGRIYLFRGLLAKAETPDEIAGVLAHELGHEANRDGLRGMIQAGGSAFLLGLLFGDVSGSSAVILVFRQLIDSAHSREAESAADNYSRDVMHQLGRPAAPMARLLARIDPLAKEQGSIFMSHPLTSERQKRLEEADAGALGQLAGKQLLSSAEWLALKSICAQGGKTPPR